MNTTFVLHGTYTPSTTFPPTTPISQFIVSDFSGGLTATIPSLQLVSGQTYSVLVAYNQTTPGSYPYTVTLTFNGPGCVQINTNVCAAVVTDRQIAEELKLQAAQQGMMLSDMQSDAIVGQLHQRMGQWGANRASAAVPLAQAYADEPLNKYASLFDNAMSQQAAQSGWTAWADTGADGLRTNWNSDVRGYQAAQQFGLDYRMANGWVAGASFGGSVFKSDFDNGGDLSGSAYWISPYLGMRIDNWLVTLQTAYTYTDYDSFDTGTGTSGKTHGQRFSGSVSVSRQFDLGQDFYVVPEAVLSAGREHISDLSGAQQGSDPSFFSTKLGGELGYKLQGGGHVYGLAYAEYTSTNADGSASYLSTDYASQDWSATLGGGFDAMLGERAKLGLEGKVRGVGSERLVYGGNARLSLDF
ncbi:autotransporter outer membrane beta-barrel domain-containing protein [Pleomorphomonas oryzae]|uniref:autotransporter outer membrane beta-barrel domain-containing protein n=1 Tax=Pleomorphomonas oryzae TaxID=261934 RepID=UPI00041BCCAB|nr:autotransporter outer membrane beta-barrel domain-containing protein [Pleomorphomonas oryzae]